MELIDIGVNLTDRAFDSDRESVLDRARAAGVCQLVITGSSVKGSESAAALAAANAGILFATAGVHPHNARDWAPTSLDAIKALAAANEVVAIGEIGLDFDRNYSAPERQEYALECQLELAAALKLPVFLHERDAHDRFCAIVAKYRPYLLRAVAHCFTGDAKALTAYLELDLHIGISGWICDPRRGLHLRELVSQIPASRLMIETDAPYLLPRTLSPRPRSRRNEPMYLPWVLRTIAHCRDESEATLADTTTRTARAFFGLPGSGSGG